VLVPDVYRQTDDGNDQTTESSDLIGRQPEVDSSAATAVLGSGRCFGDLDAHLFLRRQGRVAFSQPLQVFGSGNKARFLTAIRPFTPDNLRGLRWLRRQ
jgi:hypothetical protein